MEEVAEEVEVGFYPQEGFTEKNKDGNMENRIGVEVMELDAIIKEKTAKEIRCREGQSVLNKILKQNNLLIPFIWSLITSGRAPQDNLLGLQEAFIYQRLQISFRELTYSPPPPLPTVAAGLDSFSFPLVAPFLPAILDVTSYFAHIRSGAEDGGGGDVLWGNSGTQRLLSIQGRSWE
jgi:hypothetical protein